MPSNHSTTICRLVGQAHQTSLEVVSQLSRHLSPRMNRVNPSMERPPSGRAKTSPMIIRLAISTPQIFRKRSKARSASTPTTTSCPSNSNTVTRTTPSSTSNQRATTISLSRSTRPLIEAPLTSVNRTTVVVVETFRRSQNLATRVKGITVEACIWNLTSSGETTAIMDHRPP